MKLKFPNIVYILLFCSIIFIESNLIGQTIIETNQIEIEQGLSARIVDKVIRDGYGYFYIFSQSDIQRYDGTNFSSINYDQVTSSGLKLSNIKKVDLLENGQIIIDFGGSQFYKIEKKGFDVLKLEGDYVLTNHKLYHLEEDENSFLISRLDRNNMPIGNFVIKVKSRPQEVIEASSGFYVQDFENKITFIDTTKRTTSLKSRGKIICSNDVVFLYTSNAILKIEKDQEFIVHKFDFEDYRCGILKKDKNDRVIAAYSRRSRFFDHLFVMDADENVKELPNLLAVNSTLKDFYTDDATGTWMLGGYNGLYVINLLRDGAQVLHKRMDRKKSEFGIIISALDIDDKENVRFTIEREGLKKYIWEDSSIVKEFDAPKFEKYLQGNFKMIFDKKNKLHYVLTYPTGGIVNIYQVDFKSYEIKEIKIRADILYDISILENNKLLVVGKTTSTKERPGSGFIGEYDIKEDSLVVRLKVKSIGREIYVNEDTGNYYFGTEGGLFFLNRDFEVIDSFDRNQKDPDKYMQVDHVRIVRKYDDYVLVGTLDGGAYVIDANSRKIKKHLTEVTGLSNNKVVAIERDLEGNYWLGTYNGLTVLDEDFEVIKKVYDFDGLPSREFNTEASTMDAQGRLYFGTINGLLIVEPKKVLNWLNTTGIARRQSTAITDRNLRNLNEENINLYTSVDSLVAYFDFPGYYKYHFERPQIKLDYYGLVNSPHTSVLADAISFSKLKKGRTNYEVSLLNSPYLDKGSINVKINYLWFLKLLGLLTFVLAGIYFGAKYLNYKTQLKEREKTATNKKISELQLNALRSQMNPHFIFNALGAIQYFIQNKDTELADSYLADFAMLMRLILESSKSKTITIQDEIKLMELYIGLECMRFDKKFDWEIYVDDEVDKDFIVPPMVIQPFIENAINHGLNNLEERRGKLALSFCYVDEDIVKCIIEDNGVGREEAARLRMKKHKSRGMQIIKERIETINQAEDMSVDLNIEDLFDADQPRGTRIEIDITLK